MNNIEILKPVGGHKISTFRNLIKSAIDNIVTKKMQNYSIFLEKKLQSLIQFKEVITEKNDVFINDEPENFDNLKNLSKNYELLGKKHSRNTFKEKLRKQLKETTGDVKFSSHLR